MRGEKFCGRREAGGGIRKAENRISDCGLGIGDWGARNSEFEKQKPPPRSQRLSGNTHFDRRGAEGAEIERKREAGGGRDLFTFHLKPSTQRRSAFTLIELLGVMAIIGILSAVILPPMIAKIEDAQTTNEDAKLEEIARALLAGIKAEGRIPNPNVNPTASGGWAAMATNYAVLGTNELIFSIPNSTNDTVRRYFLSPALTNFLAGNYTPPAGGWPTDNFNNGPLYFILVSVSKDGLLFGNGCTTNANMASNDVLFLQNWAKTNTSAGRVEVNNLNIVGNIADSDNRWTNRGQFLHVKVVDLRPMIHRITLIDTACPPSATIDGGSDYVENDVITFNVGESPNQYPFSFKANASAFGSVAGVLACNPPTMIIKPFTEKETEDPGKGSRISGESSGSKAVATLTSNPAPKFQINNLTVQSFINENTMEFFVLKGTSIRLMNNDENPLLSVTIQGDSLFKYFNSAWSKTD